MLKSSEKLDLPGRGNYRNESVEDEKEKDKEKIKDREVTKYKRLGSQNERKRKSVQREERKDPSSSLMDK